MTGLEIPLIIPLALGTGLVFLVVLALGGSADVTERMTRSFWCPFYERSVTAQFEEAVWNGKRVDVASCSTFSPPTAVGCDKACLKLHKLAAGPKPRSPAGGSGDPSRRNRLKLWAP